VYARILWFSVTYKIFNENSLIKYNRGYYKQKEGGKKNISSFCQKINLLLGYVNTIRQPAGGDKIYLSHKIIT
jgi:hypothetical protein